MANRQVSREEMLARTATFHDLKPSPVAFVDTKLPGHERDIFNVIGAGVTEDAALKPAIAAVEGFNLTYSSAEPGKGAALHSHQTVEVFIPMSGKWSIYWGDDGENEVILEPWDVVSVPVGVLRGFRNIGDEEALLLGTIAGTDPGGVHWRDDVLAEALRLGDGLDEDGQIIETPAAAE